jgi:hypothetical protein
MLSQQSAAWDVGMTSRPTANVVKTPNHALLYSHAPLQKDTHYLRVIDRRIDRAEKSHTTGCPPASLDKKLPTEQIHYAIVFKK